MSEEATIIVTSGDIEGDPQGPERRQALFHRNKEAAEHILAQSANKDIVVLILDTTSCELSRIIVRKMQASHQAAWLKKTKEEVEKEGNLASVVVAGPRWDIYKTMKLIQKGLHRIDPRDPKVSEVIEILKNPAPAGMAYVMIISKGKQLAYVASY